MGRYFNFHCTWIILFWCILWWLNFCDMDNSRFNLVDSPSSLILFYIHVAFGSPTSREEQRLKGFKNRVLGKVFRLKKEEVTGGLSKLHNEELHDFYVANIWVIKLRRIRWMGHMACMERTAYWSEFVKHE